MLLKSWLSCFTSAFSRRPFRRNVSAKRVGRSPLIARSTEALECRALLTPQVSIFFADTNPIYEPGEGDSSTRIGIGRDGSTASPLAVKIQLNDPALLDCTLSATGGMSISGDIATVTIPAGQNTVYLDVFALFDGVAEGVETATFTIAPNNLSYEVNTASYIVSIDIWDNEDSGSGSDLPAVSVTAVDNRLSESGDDALIRFTRVGTSTEGFTVDFGVDGSTAGNPSDYRFMVNGVYLSSNQIVFAENQQSVDVVIKGQPGGGTEPEEFIRIALDAESEEFDISGSGIALAYITGDPAGSVPTISISTPDDEATEGQDSAVFHFARSGSTATPLIIYYNINKDVPGANPSLASSTDYSMDYSTGGSGSTGRVVIPAGQSSVDVIINARIDRLVESDENLHFTLKASAAYSFSGTGRQNIVIHDVPTPTVSFATAGNDVDATEALSTGQSDNAQVKVVSSVPAPVGGLTVTYLVSGNATENSDYEILSKSVVIPEGLTEAAIDIRPYWDTFNESDETVILQLQAGQYHDLAGSNTSKTITIHNTASTIISFGSSSYASAEPDEDGAATPAHIFIYRTGNLSIAQTVQFTFTGNATPGTDYAVTSTSVVFLAGQNVAELWITPESDQDFTESGSKAEYVDVNFDAQKGSGYQVGSPVKARVAIADAVRPTVSVVADDPDAAEDTPSGIPDKGRFTITRNGYLSQSLTINTSFDTSTAIIDNDFTARVYREDGSSFSYTNTLTFAAGESTLYVEILPRFDGKGTETAESAILRILPGSVYTQATASATVNIANASIPSVSLLIDDDDVSEDTLEGPPDEGTFVVQRTGNLSASVTVNYEFIGGAGHGIFGYSGKSGAWDYSIQVVEGAVTLLSDTGTLDFEPGQDTITLRVIPRQDTLSESSEEVELEISAVEDAFYEVASPAVQSVFIDDTILKTVNIEARDPLASEYGTGGDPDPGLFRFTRTGGLSEPLTVDFRVLGNSEIADFEAYIIDDEGNATPFAVNSGAGNHITIPANERWIDVRIVPEPDNKDAEATEDVIFDVQNGTGYTAGSEDEATVEIYNLPRQSVVLSVSDSLAQESGPGGSPDTGTFTLTRSGPAAIINNNTMTVYYDVIVSAPNADPDDDYVAFSGFVFFDEHVTQGTITLTPEFDRLLEGNENVTVLLKNREVTDYQIDYDTLSNRQRTIQIVDAPVPTVTVTAVDNAAAEWTDPDSLNPGRYKITRDSVNLAYALTVNLEMTGDAVNGADYDNIPLTVTFAPNQTDVYIDLKPIADDDDEEGNESAELQLLPGVDYQVGTNDSATVTIGDVESDDAPEIDVDVETSNQDNTCGCACEYLQPGDGIDFNGIDVALQTGAVIFNYALEAGMDAIEAAFFPMSTGRDNPHPVFTVSVTIPEGADVPEYIDARLKINGTDVSVTTFQLPVGAVAGKTYRFALQTDTAELPTGQYDYNVAVTGRYGSSGGGTPGALGDITGSAPFFNLSGSDYGRAWRIPNLSTLMPTTANGVDGYTLFRGNGTAGFFGLDGAAYKIPDGSFSQLAEGPSESGYMTLTLQNGDQQRFDSTTGQLLQQKTAQGQVTSYDYDNDGRLETVTDGTGRTFDYTYDSSTGQLSQINDFEGRQWDFDYDADMLTQVTAPPGKAGAARPIYSMSYDPSTKLLSEVTTPDDVTTTITYGDDRRFRSLTTSDGQTFSVLSGQSQVMSDPGAPENTLADADEIATSYTDAAGKTHYYVTDKFGRVVQETDAAGRVTLYERDANGQVTRQTDPDPDGAGPLAAPVTEYVYDDAGRMTEMTSPGGSVETWTYNTSNLQRRDPLTYTDARGEVTTYTYDSVTGNLLTETDALDQTTTYTYYSTGAKAGLLQQVTTPDPDGAGPRTAESTSYDYFDSNRLLKTITQADGTALSYTYDAYGYLASETDELGNVTTYETDAYGNVLTVTQPDPDGVGALSAPELSFSYDLAGRLQQTTDTTGVITTYTYVQKNGLDLVSRVETTYPVDGGGTRTLVESYTYNALGLVTSETDVLGNVTTYEYDSATSQLLTKISYPDPDGIAGPRSANVVTYTYDALGRQTAVTEGFGTPLARTTSVEYNDAGSIKTATDPLGHETAYTYDEAGNTLTVTQVDPDGNGPLTDLVTSFTYDALGQLLTSTDAAGRTTSYTYYGDGNLAAITYPDPDGAGPLTAFVVHTVYNSMGDLIESIDEMGLSTTYEYTDTGLLEKTTSPTGTESTAIYDHLGRKTQVTDDSGRTTTFTYNDLGQLTSETDYLSNVTSYTYDGLGRLESVTYPDPDGGASPLESLRVAYQYNDDGTVAAQSEYAGSNETPLRTSTFIYDQLGQLLSATDPLEQTTRYEYDVLGRTTAVIDPLLHTTSSTYNALDQLTSVTDATGYTVTQTYDGFGRLSSVFRPGIGTQLQTHDAVGNVVSTTNEEGRITTYEYDALDRPISVTDANGGNTTYEYDDDGHLIATTDPNENTIYQEYDSFGRLQRRGKDLVSSEQVESFTYSSNGNLTTYTDTLGRTTVYNYDHGRLESVVDPIEGLIEYEYDNLGRVIEVHSQHYIDSGVDHFGVIATTGYDTLGRVISQTVTGQPSVSYEYDLNDQVTVETVNGDEVTEYAYDAAGNVTQVTDPRNGETTYTYDAANRRTSTTDPLENTETIVYTPDGRIAEIHDAEGGVTEMTYTPVGNVASLTDPAGNVTTFDYDNLNQLISETTTDGTREYEYDAAGNLVRAEDRRGNVRTFTYQFDFNGSSIYQQTHEYWWDGSSIVNDIASNYDSLGRLVSEGDNGSQYVYDYTSLSQLRYVRSDVSATLEDGTAIGLWYTYDELGRLATTSAALQGSNPVGETIVAADFRNEYTYSNDGHLVSISQAGVSGVGNSTVTTKAVGFTWDQFGRLSQIDRSMVWSGNLLPYLRTTFDYDEAGALSGLTQIHVNATTTPSYSEILTTLHTYSWDYDDAGRLETATTPDGTTDYTYDDTDQLTGVDSSYQPDETYTYDENGNRTSSGYVTGNNNRVLSDGTYNYTYDAEGNRTSRTKISDGSYVSYTWDYRQRLTEITFKTSVSGTITKQVAYTYDTQNRLLVKQLDSTGNGTFEEVERYAYDGANVILQLDDTDTVEHRYLQGQCIDQLFADENAVNDVLWALTDNQGTVRDWVEFNTPSVAPTVVEHLQYDAFGQITDDSNPALDTRYAYTGREWDADAELYYYRARWYDPAVGSFISEDPLSFAAGDANLQRYVGNNPANFTDPLGFESLPSPTRGSWIDGTPGNGTFQYNDSPFNRSRDVAGAKVTFKGMHIAEGGFPASWYYGGSASAATVKIPGPVTGTPVDDTQANTEMRKIYGPKWKQPANTTWNHAGLPGSTTMELMDTDLHGAVKHEGPASAPRAATRARKLSGKPAATSPPTAPKPVSMKPVTPTPVTPKPATPKPTTPCTPSATGSAVPGTPIKKSIVVRGFGALNAYSTIKDQMEQTGENSHLQGSPSPVLKGAIQFRDQKGTFKIEQSYFGFGGLSKVYDGSGVREQISAAQRDQILEEHEKREGKYEWSWLNWEYVFTPGQEAPSPRVFQKLSDYRWWEPEYEELGKRTVY